MPKQPTKKPSPKASAKPAPGRPKKKSAARDPERAVLTREDKRTIVHNCIAGCAGRDDFGPNTQLRNIPADAQCVQTCVIDRTGKRIIVTSTDTENSIVGKL
jgi:hypothetical protein